jgi:hypothetical protein
MANNNVPHQLAFIAITHADGLCKIMQFVVRCSVGLLPPETAKRGGFTVSEDGLFWERPASDELVQAEIDYTRKHGGYDEPEHGPIVAWKHIEQQPVEINAIFKNSRRLVDDEIVPDMDKARALHMARIRVVRDAKLAETDKLVSKLDGDPIPAELKALRQKLRAIPQMLDLSKVDTIEALYSTWPEELE